jgi:16S rRNA (uracil1498-N3)-methyltransferase
MSRPPRFFISPDQVTGTQITVTGEDVRHIGTVLRMRIGDELLLCDGQGTDYKTRISQFGKTIIRTEIASRAKRELTGPRIILGQGIPKFDKMDWIVQKATELGIAAIAPLVTERTIVKLKDEEKRVIRWQKISREAAMQSNRPDIPLVETIRTFSDFLQTPDEACPRMPLSGGPGTLKLLPWEEGTEPIKNVLKIHTTAKQIIVLIGPEGGFSATEAEMAAGKGFHLVSLGPNILRTETAALTAISIVNYELA